MAITKTTTYSGTVDALPMFRKFSIEKEFEEVVDGNQRYQQETGGLIVTATFDIGGGDEHTVHATVTAAQVASLTLAQCLTAAANLLRVQLGL